MGWKRCFTVLLAIGIASWTGQAMATAQIPDVIVVDGKEHSLNTNPLDRHLHGLGDAAPKFEVTSTALWRGYIASWELKGGKLFLRSVSVPQYDPEGDEREPVEMLREIFPGEGEVVAEWYSGALIIPDGAMVEYVHMGYGSTYERYLVALVREGVETKRLRLSEREFRQYRDAQFWKFKASDAYKAMVADMKARQSGADSEYSLSDEQIDRFILEYSAEEYLSAVSDEDMVGTSPD